MAHAVRGFSLLLVYSGGFSAVCLICHFNATVRRFNVWGSLYRRSPACSVGLVCGLVAWRCPLRCGLPLALPACRRPCAPAALPAAAPGPAVRSRCPGPPAASSPCVALRQSLRESRESRWHSRSTPRESRCESRKRPRQSRSFAPKSQSFPKFRV